MTIDHSGFWPIDRMSNPPIILASVLRMPTFFRALRETTRIDRVSSYSTGRPRSKNGMTTSSSPEVKATPRKISADSSAWPGRRRHDPLGLDAEPLLGVAGRVRVELGRHQVQPDLASLRAAYSSSRPIRSVLVSTNSRGTSGL